MHTRERELMTGVTSQLAHCGMFGANIETYKAISAVQMVRSIAVMQHGLDFMLSESYGQAKVLTSNDIACGSAPPCSMLEQVRLMGGYYTTPPCPCFPSIS